MHTIDANTQERKRSLDEVQTKLEVPDNDDNNNHEDIEYVGLVKRPKTPLITSRDIEAQVAVISERKQSGCGSLPDVISSSVETTELHASRSVRIIYFVRIGKSLATTMCDSL